LWQRAIARSHTANEYSRDWPDIHTAKKLAFLNEQNRACFRHRRDRSSDDQVFGDWSGGGDFDASGSFCGWPAGAGFGMRTSNHV
jgi:hypothetical protein